MDELAVRHEFADINSLSATVVQLKKIFEQFDRRDGTVKSDIHRNTRKTYKSSIIYPNNMT